MPSAKNMLKLKQNFAKRNVKVLVTFLSALTVFMSTSFLSYAQDNAQESEEAQVTLNLQDVDILVLINTVAEISGKNFIVDPRVKGKVSVISGATLNPDELYDVFLSILEVHNFATVSSGNVIKVLPSNVIKQRPTPTLFSPTEDTNDAQITQIIQLQHASVQDLVAIIRPLIPATSHFAPHVPSNSVVITDTTANIQRVLKIIQRIDVPDQSANVRVVYLTKAKASDLAGTLTQIVASNANPQDAAQGSSTSIQAVDAINALVISASDSEFTKIQALINELDIERDLQADINVIALKHAKSEDLVTILNDVTSGGQAEGAVGEFSVQADEATNSLIVKASSGQLKTVQSVIDQLDKQRAQVYVETVIAEISINEDANLGVQFGAGGERSVGTTTSTDADGNTTTTSSGSIGNLVDDDNTNTVIGTALTNTLFGLAADSSGAGFNFGLLDFGKYSLDILVNAIREDTNSNVLSTPTILTLDNEEAEIIVGQEVPFVTGTFNNGTNNSTDVDANGNTVSSTIGSGFQTIERQDVGIRLTIKPQISDGDTIQMEIFQEISNVVGTAIGGTTENPITNQRSIETVVQADDGQVIVLGGLIQDDVTETISYVPFLGKLPVIGALFRNKSKTAIKRNLMVFLKPHIIRSSQDLAKFSSVRYDEVRRDGQLARLEEVDFLLIPDTDPPVLEEYDSVIDEGELTSERRRKLAEKYREEGVPENKIQELLRLLRLDKTNVNGVDEFKTQGKLEDSSERKVIDLYNNNEPSVPTENLQPKVQPYRQLDNDTSRVIDLIESEPLETNQ